MVSVPKDMVASAGAIGFKWEAKNLSVEMAKPATSTSDLYKS
jgi:hypothetical protein